MTDSTLAKPTSEKLAQRCEAFMKGAKRLYDGERIKSCAGDMWFFELYHHLENCRQALTSGEHP